MLLCCLLPLPLWVPLPLALPCSSCFGLVFLGSLPLAAASRGSAGPPAVRCYSVGANVPAELAWPALNQVGVAPMLWSAIPRMTTSTTPRKTSVCSLARRVDLAVESEWGGNGAVSAERAIGGRFDVGNISGNMPPKLARRASQGKGMTGSGSLCLPPSYDRRVRRTSLK